VTSFGRDEAMARLRDTASRFIEGIQMEIAMQAQAYIPLGVILVFAAAIVGIFSTKTPGFGRYSTTALLLTLVLFSRPWLSCKARSNGHRWRIFSLSLSGLPED
jgi:hypothetical protein